MRVALYYPWIYLTSGGERIIAELTRRSRHEWLLFTSHYDPESTFPELRSRGVVELNRVSVQRDMLSVARSAGSILRQKLPPRDYDAIFVLGEGLGDLILFRNHSRPVLGYCLTPLRAAFDPVYQAQAYAKRGLPGKLALSGGLALFRAIDRLAWKHYSRLLFVSQEAVRRARAGGLLGRHVPEVLYTGVGLSADRPSDTFDPFFLIPGRIMWTKNVQLGIRAFQEFQSAHPEYRNFRLWIAGVVDQKSRPYLEELRELTAGDPRIQFQLAPTDQELRRLYETCYAVLFPPLNEYLGIVPIESMAFGKPVIAVNQGGPRETIEHGAHGFLASPAPREFAGLMAALAANPGIARAMGRAGFRHARDFSWDHFVGRIDDLLEEMAPQNSGAGNPACRRLSDGVSKRGVA